MKWKKDQKFYLCLSGKKVLWTSRPICIIQNCVLLAFIPAVLNYISISAKAARKVSQSKRCGRSKLSIMQSLRHQPTFWLWPRSRMFSCCLWITARPRSPMQHVRLLFTRMFLDLMSRWAMAGLPRFPIISVWRWDKPAAAECTKLSICS